MTENNKITDLYDRLKGGGYECLYSKHEEGLAFHEKREYHPKLPSMVWKVESKIPEYEEAFMNTKECVLVVSDTHDDVVAMEYVMKRANAMGIRFMVHAGDIVHNGMMATFREFRGRIFGVLGNHDRLNAAHYVYEHPCMDLKWDTNRFSIYGKSFVVNHGESIAEMVDMVEKEGGADFTIYGHWHAPCFFRNNEKKKCVINPGMFTTTEPVFLLLNIKDPMASIYVKLEPRKGVIGQEEDATETEVVPPVS